MSRGPSSRHESSLKEDSRWGQDPWARASSRRGPWPGSASPPGAPPLASAEGHAFPAALLLAAATRASDGLADLKPPICAIHTFISCGSRKSGERGQELSPRDPSTSSTEAEDGAAQTDEEPAARTGERPARGHGGVSAHILAVPPPRRQRGSEPGPRGPCLSATRSHGDTKWPGEGTGPEGHRWHCCRGGCGTRSGSGSHTSGLRGFCWAEPPPLRTRTHVPNGPGSLHPHPALAGPARRGLAGAAQ